MKRCIGPLVILFLGIMAVTAFAQEKNIRVDLGPYNPGVVPSAIGDPVEQSGLIAKDWEILHPDTKVTFQVVIQTSDSEGEWLKTQLIGKIAPEIIHQNAETAWSNLDKNWYVPLDEFIEQPNPYIPGNKRWLESFTNQALVNAKRAPDGKLYCIPIDVVETGIFYNKTLLNEMGIEGFPDTWEKMMAMNAIIAEHNITPIATLENMNSDWGQDIIFELLYHDILEDLDMIPSPPDAEGYLGHYLDPPEFGFLVTKGFFTSRDPRWRELNRMLLEWREYWPKELKNTDPMRLFLTKRLAMYWNGSWCIRRLALDPYVDFEWGVAYIPTITKATSHYSSETQATVIGGAAVQLHVTNSAIENDLLEECVDFLMYISAPQNLERMTGEAMIYIPNVNGAKIDQRLAPFQEIYQRPYCAIKLLESMDGKYKKYWRRMLDYYLNDGIDLEGFLQLLDQNLLEWSASHQGGAGWDFENMEATWQERKEVLLRELDPE